MPSVRFRDVEVIELPIVPGADHPTNRNSNQNNDSSSSSTFRVVDTAAITLDWKAQSRTTVHVDTYERTKRRKFKHNKRGLTDILLPRAVRKRMLRKQGFETSDTEDEGHSLPRRQVVPRKTKKKKKSKSRNKKTCRGDEIIFDNSPRQSNTTNNRRQQPQPKRRLSGGEPKEKKATTTTNSSRSTLSTPADDESFSKRHRRKQQDQTSKFSLRKPRRSSSPTPPSSSHSSSSTNNYFEDSISSFLSIASWSSSRSHGMSTDDDDYYDEDKPRSWTKRTKTALGSLVKQPVKLAKSTRKRFSTSSSTGSSSQHHTAGRSTSQASSNVDPSIDSEEEDDEDDDRSTSTTERMNTSSSEQLVLPAVGVVPPLRMLSLDEEDGQPNPKQRTTTQEVLLSPGRSRRRWSSLGIVGGEDEHNRHHHQQQPQHHRSSYSNSTSTSITHHVLGSLKQPAVVVRDSLGTLAKQPARLVKSTPNAIGTLAKQPVRLVKSTHRRLSKRRTSKQETKSLKTTAATSDTAAAAPNTTSDHARVDTTTTSLLRGVHGVGPDEEEEEELRNTTVNVGGSDNMDQEEDGVMYGGVVDIYTTSGTSRACTPSSALHQEVMCALLQGAEGRLRSCDHNKSSSASSCASEDSIDIAELEGFECLAPSSNSRRSTKTENRRTNTTDESNGGLAGDDSSSSKIHDSSTESILHLPLLYPLQSVSTRIDLDQRIVSSSSSARRHSYSFCIDSAVRKEENRASTKWLSSTTRSASDRFLMTRQDSNTSNNNNTSPPQRPIRSTFPLPRSCDHDGEHHKKHRLLSSCTSSPPRQPRRSSNDRMLLLTSNAAMRSSFPQISSSNNSHAISISSLEDESDVDYGDHDSGSSMRFSNSLTENPHTDSMTSPPVIPMRHVSVSDFDISGEELQEMKECNRQERRTRALECFAAALPLRADDDGNDDAPTIMTSPKNDALDGADDAASANHSLSEQGTNGLVMMGPPRMPNRHDSVDVFSLDDSGLSYPVDSGDIMPTVSPPPLPSNSNHDDNGTTKCEIIRRAMGVLMASVPFSAGDYGSGSVEAPITICPDIDTDDDAAASIDHSLPEGIKGLAVMTGPPRLPNRYDSVDVFNLEDSGLSFQDATNDTPATRRLPLPPPPPPNTDEGNSSPRCRIIPPRVPSRRGSFESSSSHDSYTVPMTMQEEDDDDDRAPPRLPCRHDSMGSMNYSLHTNDDDDLMITMTDRRCDDSTASSEAPPIDGKQPVTTNESCGGQKERSCWLLDDDGDDNNETMDVDEQIAIFSSKRVSMTGMVVLSQSSASSSIGK